MVVLHLRMANFPRKLSKSIEERRNSNAERQLSTSSNSVDFSSNDYLGFAKNQTIFKNAHQFLIDNGYMLNGATGSRLLTGNHELYNKVETLLCDVHKTEAALIFNSGYDANIGLFSCVPQRGDIILYDEFIHASIRDGIRLSKAKAYKFKHNNLNDLKEKIVRFSTNKTEFFEVYVVTESVFSMDGDSPDLEAMVQICKTQNAHLIIDQAHAVGVFNKGLVQHLNIEDEVFARIITFGKAMGCHGAAILGSKELKQYLVNFSRSFIYTTGLPPHSLATIKVAYNKLAIANTDEQSKLLDNINHFKSEIKRLQLNFIESNSAIHCCVISGNERVKTIANMIQENRFDVKPILSPTVPKGQERLRFCLHSYNSKEEISEVLGLLSTFVN
jgi:8-amino-7-oxononanoate synthase